MKKISSLKFFDFVLTIAVALIFIGVYLLQAQVETTGKPPEDNWGVQIPGTSTMLKGKELSFLYLNNDEDVRVTVDRLEYRHKGKKGFYYEFEFMLFNPDDWAFFQDVDFVLCERPDPDKPCCIFPGVSENCYLEKSDCDPGCMENFLYGQHPRDGYSHLRIAFMICNIEIEEMDISIPVKYTATDEMDTISFSVWYSSECDRDYHNIGTWVRPAEGLSIERTAENTWRIHVYQDLYVRESYCEEVPIGKGKKTKQEIYTPLAATGFFDFQMDWIKNPL